MPTGTRPFYGWYLVAALWVIYGFGITPAYISWGFFAPEMIKELGFSRGDIGFVFFIFTFLYSALGLVVGLLQKRFGIRNVMFAGALCASAGMFIMSRANSLFACVVGFALLGGLGIGLSTIVPCQTIAQNWFVKRRAVAIAIIFSAGGIAGRLWPRINEFMLSNYDWRMGFVAIGAMSAFLALPIALLARDNPEPLNQPRDGKASSFQKRMFGVFAVGTLITLIVRVVRGGIETPQEAIVHCILGIGAAMLFMTVVAPFVLYGRGGEKRADEPEGEGTDNQDAAPALELSAVDRWTAREAMVTPQFIALVLCGCAYALPWGVIAAHGRLHLEDSGLEVGVIGAIIGTMFLISVIGRLSGALGDLLPPAKVMAVSLAIEALGVLLFFYADTERAAYMSVVLVGIGFGAAYVSIPVVFAEFFGRVAFATTSGMRILITGIFNGLAPFVTGLVYDRLESYAIPFLGLVALCIAGSVTGALLRRPEPPAAPA